MRVAIIDIGTNTFHLLIAEVLPDGGYTKVYSSKNSVKLGRGGINQNFIHSGPFKKGVATLAKYKSIAAQYNADKIFAFATSAVRSATNGKHFVDEVEHNIGIEIRVITGNEEAELIYEGVRQALDIGPEKCLIMDIGGGSVEFIIADYRKSYWRSSYNMGVARILEMLKPSDPIKPQEVTAEEIYLDNELKPLFTELSKHKIDTLIGASGSFDTFAEMIAYKYLSPSVLHDVTCFDFNMTHYNEIHHQLLLSTKEARKKTKGIIPMRVDMIVLASVMVNYVINKAKIKKMRLSTYALKEGVLANVIRNGRKEQD